MKNSDIANFKLEILIASDVRSFVELLQLAFDEERAERGLTKSNLANLVGKDLSYVSRILNGRQKNVTLHTLASFMRAMGRRLEPSQSSLADLESRKPNYQFSPRFTDVSRVGTSAVSAEIPNGTSKGFRTYSPKTTTFSPAP